MTKNKEGTEKQLSDTVEDYLKVVYDLSAGNDLVCTGQIAEALMVSPASVTDMVQRLLWKNHPYWIILNTRAWH